MINNKSFFVVFLQLIQSVLSAVTFIFIANYLGVKDNGVYVYFTTITSLIPLFLGLGGEHVFIMLASRDDSLVPYLWGNAIIVRLVFSLVAIGGVILVLTYNPFLYGEHFIIIFCGSLIAVFYNPLFISLYRIKGLHIRPWVIGLIAPIIFIIYLAIFQNLSSRLNTVAWGFLISHSITLLFFIFDTHKISSIKFSFPLIRANFLNGIYFSISQLFDYAFARVDIFLLQYFLGAASVGIYSVAQRIVTLLQLIPSSFHIVELPEFHRLHKHPIELTERFRKLRKLLLELAIILFGIIIINNDLIVSLLFDSTYSRAASIIIILSLAGGILFINYPYYMLAEAIDKVRKRLIIRVVSFFITLLVMALLIQFIGIKGAAIGIVIGQLFFMLLLHFITRTNNGGLMMLAKDSKLFLVAVPILFLSKLVLYLLPLSIIYGILSSVFYLGTIYYLGKRYNILEIDQFLINGINLVSNKIRKR